MSNKTTQLISFWNLIKNYDIEIPIIQRDYAQGRLGKEYLRKNFLSNIKATLDNNKILKLDFVYGSIEENKMYPLDGQQRLTTIWLLHWYIALRAGLLYRACPILKKFSYETRISSREFCEQLCKPKNFESYIVDDSIVNYITNQTWFYSTWKQDPTIQAMLRMLSGTKINDQNGEDIIDGLEEVFKCTRQPKFNNYWWILCSDKSPIKFYHLALKDFGLSDDLYIKMNARGKQLTAFEIFKADLIEFLRKQDEKTVNTSHNVWRDLLNPTDGIPFLLDTIWTDIFWKNKSVGVMDENCSIRNANQIDEIYFAFINRFFWNELFVSKYNGEYVLRIGNGNLNDGTETHTIENFNPSYKYLNEDRYDIYSDFSPYQYFPGKTIPFSLFQDMKLILERWGNYEGLFPRCNWDGSFQFIPEYEKNEKNNNIQFENNNKDKTLRITTLNQVQRIVFFAVCKYFKEGAADTVSLNRWMRVVWNLVSGEDESGRSQIRNTEALRKAIEFIDLLDSHNVYSSIITTNIVDNSEFERRCIEEKEKALKILKDDGSLREYNGICTTNHKRFETWEDIIKESESFFKGSIRFLFHNGDGNINWDDFDVKWNNAKRYFCSDGTSHSDTLINYIEKYLNDEEIIYLGTNYYFTNKSTVWRSILLDRKLRNATHGFLMGCTVKTTSTLLKQQLLLLLSKIKNNLWILADWNNNTYVLTNYEVRRGNPNNGYVFAIGTRRHELVTDLKNNGIDVHIPKNNIGDESYFKDGIICYRGLYATINYKKNTFRIIGDGWIYLMDKGKTDRKIKNENASENIERYYCFDANNVNNSSIFENMLNCLIQQSSAKDNGKSCFDMCPSAQVNNQ